MGDRVNVKVVQESGALFLYGHWLGEGAVAAVRNALQKYPGRHEDPSYLTRLIAREMGMGEPGETGFGISISPDDSNHAFLVVDIPRQEVRIETDQRGNDTIGKYNAGVRLSFRDFIAGA